MARIAIGFLPLVLEKKKHFLFGKSSHRSVRIKEEALFQVRKLHSGIEKNKEEWQKQMEVYELIAQVVIYRLKSK